MFSKFLSASVLSASLFLVACNSTEAHEGAGETEAIASGTFQLKPLGQWTAIDLTGCGSTLFAKETAKTVVFAVIKSGKESCSRLIVKQYPKFSGSADGDLYTLNKSELNRGQASFKINVLSTGALEELKNPRGGFYADSAVSPQKKMDVITLRMDSPLN
jgi:hypothetical protein